MKCLPGAQLSCKTFSFGRLWYIVRCTGVSEVAARLFGEDHITEIKVNDDGMSMLVMTRDRHRFARALGQIALDGHRIDGVVPADENVDALYEYLIGGE